MYSESFIEKSDVAVNPLFDGQRDPFDVQRPLFDGQRPHFDGQRYGTIQNREAVKSLDENCSHLHVGSDMRSLEEVAKKLRLARSIQYPNTTLDVTHIYVSDSNEEVSTVFPLLKRCEGIDGLEFDSAPTYPRTRMHWFHLDSYYRSRQEAGDHASLISFGGIIGVSPRVISTTMDRFFDGKIGLTHAEGCVGIAFVDLLKVDEESLQGLGSIRQAPMAIFYSLKANAVLSIRCHMGNSNNDPWENIRGQVHGRTSLLYVNRDASYLLFLLVDAVIDKVEPLLNDYGDLVEGLDYLFHQHEATTGRCDMSRILQQDLWTIRRWGWSINMLSEDLPADPWDIFTDEQEKFYKILRTQCKVITEIAQAFISKAESQEECFGMVQDKQTNNLLYNLTMFTIVMLPPQFLAGVYGMNFGRHSYLLFLSQINFTCWDQMSCLSFVTKTDTSCSGVV